jgi:hypothetical protein
MIKYDKNNNPIRVISSPVNHDKKWRDQSHLESFKYRGNGWWWFQGVIMLKHRVTWIEKYRKGD